MTSIKHDIVFRIEPVSRFIESPHQSNLQATNCILRYIKGTQSDSIFYAYDNMIELVGYTYS